MHKQIDSSLALDECAVVAGQTHYHQVLDALGPPTRMSVLPGGFAFLYESLSIREWQVGLSGRGGWLKLIKLSLANTHLYRQILALHFDTDGLLVAYGRTDSKEDLGKGGSVQFLFSLQQITDTADYEDDANDSADWGASLLCPLPVGLNMAQSLNSGTAGLEQSGTTPKVGQHALEMR